MAYGDKLTSRQKGKGRKVGICSTLLSCNVAQVTRRPFLWLLQWTERTARETAIRIAAKRAMYSQTSSPLDLLHYLQSPLLFTSENEGQLQTPGAWEL
jgi:hypothetical protein